MSTSEGHEKRYKLWKQYTPFLYDYVSTLALTWPSYSVEFIQNSSKVLLSTSNGGQEDNFVHVYDYATSRHDASTVLERETSVLHLGGDVQCASAMPKSEALMVGTQGTLGVCLLDYASKTCSVLDVGSANGMYLEWNKHKNHRLAVGGKTVAVLDNAKVVNEIDLGVDACGGMLGGWFGLFFICVVEILYLCWRISLFVFRDSSIASL